MYLIKQTICWMQLFKIRNINEQYIITFQMSSASNS